MNHGENPVNLEFYSWPLTWGDESIKSVVIIQKSLLAPHMGDESIARRREKQSVSLAPHMGG